MTIQTQCNQCGKPLEIKVADSTTEKEADKVARTVLCVRCAVAQLVRVTAQQVSWKP